jgi:hypothetical protein
MIAQPFDAKKSDIWPSRYSGPHSGIGLPNEFEPHDVNAMDGPVGSVDARRQRGEERRQTRLVTIVKLLTGETWNNWEAVGVGLC